MPWKYYKFSDVNFEDKIFIRPYQILGSPFEHIFDIKPKVRREP
jgi:hypothetical protein